VTITPSAVITTGSRGARTSDASSDRPVGPRQSAVAARHKHCSPPHDAQYLAARCQGTKAVKSAKQRAIPYLLSVWCAGTQGPNFRQAQQALYGMATVASDRMLWCWHCRTVVFRIALFSVVAPIRQGVV